MYLSDDMGSWKNNGVDTTHIRVNSFSDSEVESVESSVTRTDDNGVPTLGTWQLSNEIGSTITIASISSIC